MKMRDVSNFTLVAQLGTPRPEAMTPDSRNFNRLMGLFTTVSPSCKEACSKLADTRRPKTPNSGSDSNVRPLLAPGSGALHQSAGGGWKKRSAAPPRKCGLSG